MNRDELIAHLVNAIQTLHCRWGNVRTNQGSISIGWQYITLGKNFHNWPCDNVNFVLHEGVWSSQGSLNDLLRAENTIAGLACFLASHDFVDRVDGSIKRLKAIAKAIEE